MEKLFLNGTKRVAGLHLLSHIIELDLGKSIKNDCINWFCAGLRDNKNTLVHYLNHIKGCGNYLEEKCRKNFFQIYDKILEELKHTKEKKDAILLLDALKWKFTGRDHHQLLKLNVFQALHQGNGHRKNIIKRSWGRPVSQNPTDEAGEERELTKEVLLTYEHLFLTVVARIVDEDLGQAMAVKSKGTAIPTLERSKSVIDTNASEALIA